MNQLLRNIESITRQRDRARLDAALVNALYELSKAARVRLYKLQWVKSEALVGLAAERSAGALRQLDDGISGPVGTVPLSAEPRLAECLSRRTGCLHCKATSAGGRHIFLIGQHKATPSGFMELFGPNPIRPGLEAAITTLIRVFENCNDLLDYCEIDSLTGLLNRKTFDEHLFKILTRVNDSADDDATPGPRPQRRQPHPGADGHWIGVLDIDHFKRINDGFGHLIGDEVLLMLANRMKSHFRAQDRLFRFGGEEFVLLLKPAEAGDAQSAFERFRQAVESNPFPQVGQVTVSIGCARLGLDDDPTAVLENADRALYWAKEHGRNRVCAYEALLAADELQPPSITRSDVELF